MPPGAFDDLLNLISLSFRSSALTTVPALHGMRSLQVLDLCCTAIESVPSRAFQGLSNLRVLNLAGNGLTDLPDGLLSGMADLKYLYLNGNRLTDIRKEVLAGPVLLIRLSLHGNPLRELREDAFATLPHASQLFLTDTQLEAIRPLTFATVDISSLFLEDNRIADLAGVVFPPNGVSTLQLTNNALRELPAGLFTGFHSTIGGRENLTVDLTGNPGTPFPIHLDLVRLDANPDEPGPASVVVRVREAAPWTMAVRVAALGGTTFARDVEVPIGRLESEPFTVADNGVALLRFGSPPPIPGTYEGMEVALGDPLRLFPFKDLDLKVAGAPFEIDLAAVLDGAEAGTRFTATSSAPGVATAAVADGSLTVKPLREGRVTVTVTSRSPSGATTRHRFGVTVADRDGSPETANLLAVGATLAGTLLDETDVDVYRLDLPGDATVELQTSGPTDTRGRLQDRRGTYIAADEGSGPGGHNFKIEAGIPAGIYYLTVSGATGDYAVVARLAEALDQGDTEADSSLLTLYTAEDLRRVSPDVLLSTPSAISSAADLDVFRLDIPRDRTDVTVRTTGGTDLHARLLDSALVEIASDEGGGNVRIDTELDVGPHYLEIGGHETGNYRVLASGGARSCLREMPIALGDIGDDPASSALLTMGGAPRAGKIDDVADVDVFRLDLAGRARVEVRTGGATDTEGELLRVGGATVASDDDGGPGGHNFRIVQELPAGIYYVKVSGAPGSYSVSARLTGTRDQGNTAASATLLPLFTERELAPVRPRMLLGTAARIWPTAADVDVFRLDVPNNNTRVVVRTAGGTALRGELVDSQLAHVATDRRGDDIRIETELEAGIYYLSVTGHTTGNYRVLASTESPGVCH